MWGRRQRWRSEASVPGSELVGDSLPVNLVQLNHEGCNIHFFKALSYIFNLCFCILFLKDPPPQSNCLSFMHYKSWIHPCTWEMTFSTVRIAEGASLVHMERKYVYPGLLDWKCLWDLKMGRSSQKASWILRYSPQERNNQRNRYVCHWYINDGWRH